MLMFFYCSEPSVRGALTGLAGISVTSGIFLIYWMGNVMAWRMAASISATMPLVTAIAVCFVSDRISSSSISQTNNLLIVYSHCRFRKHRSGCCPKIVRPMLYELYNGCAVGCPLPWFKTNLTKSCVIIKWQRRAMRANGNR